MKLLITSDTHRSYRDLREAVLRHPEAALIFHLGDGAEDLDDIQLEFPERRFLAVRGNNDHGSGLPAAGEITLEGLRIFYTHGHLYQVKCTLDTLAQEAKKRGAALALFGHTHLPYAQPHGGVFLCNPGALCEGSYALLTLEDGQFSAEHRNI